MLFLEDATSLSAVSGCTRVFSPLVSVSVDWRRRLRQTSQAPHTTTNIALTSRPPSVTPSTHIIARLSLRRRSAPPMTSSARVTSSDDVVVTLANSVAGWLVPYTRKHHTAVVKTIFTPLHKNEITVVRVYRKTEIEKGEIICHKHHNQYKHNRLRPISWQRVEPRRFISHRWSFTSNLEKVANIPNGCSGQLSFLY